MKIEKHGKLVAVLSLFALIAVLIIAVFSRLDDQHSGHGAPPPLPARNGDVVRFGDIAVCLNIREIRFRGEVRQAEGSVWLLLHLAGYQWLEETAAIVSSARLLDLQKAIALLDWKLWDQLWQGKDCGEGVEVRIDWGGDKIAANDLIDTEQRLDISDLVYLGSPFFDALFLTRCKRTMFCLALKRRDLCPLHILHETIEAKLVRECGQRGYLLNYERLPVAGTAVTVSIRVPYPARGDEDDTGRG